MKHKKYNIILLYTDSILYVNLGKKFELLLYTIVCYIKGVVHLVAFGERIIK